LDLTTKLSAPYAQPYDQGNIGSCTANASCFIYVFDELKQNVNFKFLPSRLFIYYNSRVLSGDVNSDGGSSIRDSVKSLVQSGVCEEKLWPYDPNNLFNKPGAQCYAEGRFCKAVKYAAVNQNLNSLKTALNNGFPINFGFTVYESFESVAVEQTGLMPMPQPGEQILGGHAVVIVGYDDAMQRFKIRNSWGINWGCGGYFWMPYQFATDPNYCNDFWMVTSLTNPHVTAPTH